MRDVVSANQLHLVSSECFNSWFEYSRDLWKVYKVCTANVRCIQACIKQADITSAFSPSPSEIPTAILSYT